MGAITWQSIQVPEKNSIKIKSFCFGISVRMGVYLATWGAVIVAGRLIGVAGLQEYIAKASIAERK